MSELREAALSYARLGWSIFPVEPRGKRPVHAGGFKTATSDLEQIEQWWTRNPDFNIGLHPGPSNLLVMDSDGPAGEALAVALGFTTEPTRMVNTGRADGGRHRYFQRPDFAIGNAPLGPGLDVRCDAGYVVAPPSVHPSGRRYEWNDPVAPILQAPASLLTALRSGHASAKGSPVEAEGLIPRGQRNQRLTSIAGALRRHGLGLDAILDALLAANRELCDPPLSAREVERIARSIGKYEPEPLPENIAERCTDLANARRLVDQRGEDFLWVQGLGWLSWDGCRFATDGTGAVHRAAKEVVRGIVLEAADVAKLDTEKGKRLLSWGIASQSAPRIHGLVKLAETEPEVVSRTDELDTDPWLLNVCNGTLDLRTGTLRAHERGDKLTRLAPVHYNPEAGCPLWEAFLARVLRDDRAVIGFLQRFAGYALTGSTREQCLLLAHVDGANGKSTCLETLAAVVGDYGTAMNFSTLTTATRQRQGPSEDIARLRGLRFVTAIETGKGQQFNEELLKQLTGGDTVAARFLFQNTFTFRPQFKLFLAANHRPTVSGTDHAIWRRIKLVPFTVQIPERERDPDLPRKLREELPGILNWILAGCRAWLSEGLGEAEAVTQATAAYRNEQDVVRAFLEEECEVGPDYTADWEELFDRYTDWCLRTDREADSVTGFGRRLTEAGFGKDRRGMGRRYRRLGLRLQPLAM